MLRFVTFACVLSGARTVLPDLEGLSPGQQLFRLGMDMDGDNKVTLKEMENWMEMNGDSKSGAKDLFQQLDKNGDNKLTPKEANDFMKASDPDSWEQATTKDTEKTLKKRDKTGKMSKQKNNAGGKRTVSVEPTGATKQREKPRTEEFGEADENDDVEDDFF